MYKLNVILLVLLAFNINCNGNKEPVITLGKTFDKTKIEVSEKTNIFNRNDIFAYTLSQRDPFGTEIINRRIYQGKEYINMILKESINIAIQPGTTIIGDSMPVEKLIQKFGSGNFLILFTINDSVIARKPFTIEGKLHKTAGPNEKQVNQEIMPLRTEKNMPIPNTYGTNEAATNEIITPEKTEKYIPNTETKDDASIQRITPGKQEKPNIPIMSPSEMMK